MGFNVCTVNIQSELDLHSYNTSFETSPKWNTNPHLKSVTCFLTDSNTQMTLA